MTMDDYPRHQRSAILLMKVNGLLSMIASHFITRDVLIRYNKGERIRLTYEIVFELSMANFWGSFFSAFMSTWMVPQETGAYQASGNTASCTAQGFFDSFFYGLSVIMNSVLAITYCIIVKRGKKDEATRGTRRMVLGLPPIICLLLAIQPLFDQAYNYSGIYVCGIAEYPQGCLYEHDEHECTRGSNAMELVIAHFACICFANLIIVASVSVLIHHVVSNERRLNTNMTENTNNNLSIKATWQGIFYVTIFMICWGPWYIWQWMHITSEMKTMSTVDSPALLYLISITYPLQGVGSALVYFRPKYLKFRDRDNAELRLASVLRSLDITVPSFLTTPWWQSNKNNIDSS